MLRPISMVATDTIFQPHIAAAGPELFQAICRDPAGGREACCSACCLPLVYVSAVKCKLLTLDGDEVAAKAIFCTMYPHLQCRSAPK